MSDSDFPALSPTVPPHSGVPRDAAEQLRLALETGEMGTWEWRIADGRVTWSEALERMHGLEPRTFGGTFADHERLPGVQIPDLDPAVVFFVFLPPTGAMQDA